MNSVAAAAYIALFVGLGAAFLFVNLLVGRFLRPKDPHAEKLEIYECGEPTIGSGFVQFDLRFYVVALLFLIFDVEVALFFPWATVFGKAKHLADVRIHDDRARAVAMGDAGNPQRDRADAAIRGLYAEMGVPLAAQPNPENAAAIRSNAKELMIFSFWDILIFFGVLMTGFAYVWSRGDLDWVRAVSQQRAARAPPGSGPISDTGPTGAEPFVAA